MTDEIKRISEQEVKDFDKRYAEALRGVPYPLERILSVAQGWVKTGDNKYKALCPCHDDTNPSLSIDYDSENQNVLLYCHSCADEKQYGDFLTAWGLDPTELVMPNKRGIVATYDYTDEEENLLYQRVRFEPKRFLYRRPDESGQNEWIWKLNGVRRVLYRLPELCAAKSPEVLFVEGEKDCNVLYEHGFIATTSGGANSWRPKLAEPLHGRKVFIIPDRDTPGEKFAHKVANDLLKVAASVKIVRLKYGKDVADFFKLGGNANMLRDEIRWAKPVTDTTHASAPTVTWLDEVELKEVCWLWQDRIPLGKLTLLAGEAGIGKSLLTLDIAARISTGTAWPDERGKPDIGSVLICTSEDDTEDTVGVRLAAAGADLNKVAHVENVFDMNEVVEIATKTLKSTGDIRLIILDPLTEFLGNADSHKNAEVRRALTPLISFASEHSVAILGVTHYSKRSATCLTLPCSSILLLDRVSVGIHVTDSFLDAIIVKIVPIFIQIHTA